MKLISLRSLHFERIDAVSANCVEHAHSFSTSCPLERVFQEVRIENRAASFSWGENTRRDVCPSLLLCFPPSRSMPSCSIIQKVFDRFVVLFRPPRDSISPDILPAVASQWTTNDALSASIRQYRSLNLFPSNVIIKCTANFVSRGIRDDLSKRGWGYLWGRRKRK